MTMTSLVNDEEIKYIPDLDQMIREETCKKLTTLANSTRWRMEKEGKFPQRQKLGARSVAYRLSEVQAWIRGEWHPGWKPEKKQ